MNRIIVQSFLKAAIYKTTDGWLRYQNKQVIRTRLKNSYHSSDVFIYFHLAPACTSFCIWEWTITRVYSSITIVSTLLALELFLLSLWNKQNSFILEVYERYVLIFFLIFSLLQRYQPSNLLDSTNKILPWIFAE